MNTSQNNQELSIRSHQNGRSQSIPKPPCIPPPPIPRSESEINGIDEFKRNGERLRAASESKISSIIATSNHNDNSLSRLEKNHRSVSFSKTQRRRASTGKGILKKSVAESHDQVTKELIYDSRHSIKTRKKRSSKKGSSSRSKSAEFEQKDENRGRSSSVRRSSDKLTKGLLVLPVTASPTVEDTSETGVNPVETDLGPKNNQNQSIFSHIGKNESDFVDHILKIHVHGADELITDVNIRNPLVRVSLIDLNTGKYVLKSKMERKVTSAIESDYLNVILPSLTRIYSFSTVQSSNEPKWEEELIFNENYLYVLQPNIIIGFEILNLIKSKKSLSKETDGWKKIAWGFIKLIGQNGKVNTEQKARLQLFKYPWHLPWAKKPSGVSDLFFAYKSLRVKYPSTLYVTVAGSPKMDFVQVKNRPRYPTEIETGRMTLTQMVKSQVSRKVGISRSLLNINSTVIVKNVDDQHESWRYKKGHPFKLPNKALYGFDCGLRGAFSCSFSHNGLYLAIACVGSNTYPIKVYDMIAGERVATLEGHQDLVYNLTWSSDDTELLSASSDSTVRIWNFDENGSVFNVGNIPHASFVYNAVYHPLFCNEKKVIVTAGYDGLIRVWKYEIESKISPMCINTAVGHKNYVNSLLFDEDGLKLYSADSAGFIKVWDSSLNEDQEPIFKCITTVDIFYGIPICHLSIHYSSRKILVQTTSNTLHILDSRILKVLTHIDPLPKPFLKKNLVTPILPPLPNPVHTLFRRSQFSPCGTFILSGTNIYETDSGNRAGSYDSHGTVTDVAWHPNDFMCCLVEYGSCRTKIYTYDSACKNLTCPKAEVKNTQVKTTQSHHDPIAPPLKNSVSDTLRNALTQLKLGEDLFSAPKIGNFEGVTAKTVGI